MKIIKIRLSRDIWLVVVHLFCVVKGANCLNIWSKKINNNHLKSFVLHINILNMKHYSVHYRVVYCSNLKDWAGNWQNLKSPD